MEGGEKMKDLLKSKTFWTGVLAVVGSAAGYATGELDQGTAINTAVTGLLAIFLRDGIAKK